MGPELANPTTYCFALLRRFRFPYSTMYTASRNSAAHELFHCKWKNGKGCKMSRNVTKFSGAQSSSPPDQTSFSSSQHRRAQPTSIWLSDHHRIACGTNLSPLSSLSSSYIGRVLCVMLFCKCLGEKRIAGGEDRRRGPSKRSAEKWFVSRYAKKSALSEVRKNGDRTHFKRKRGPQQGLEQQKEKKKRKIFR